MKFKILNLVSTCSSTASPSLPINSDSYFNTLLSTHCALAMKTCSLSLLLLGLPHAIASTLAPSDLFLSLSLSAPQGNCFCLLYIKSDLLFMLL